jgi:erythronate-4-phosphate dehydrogenase
MKIIVDNKIPYIKGVLEPYAEVVYLPGNLTTAEAVKDADALVTRTRTLCNEDVLAGSKIKLIATATIGFDHIDTDYCEAAGIEWSNAPGCNAESVNQYVSSALFSYSKRKGFDLAGKTIGVVGVGQVGSRIAKICEILGMQVFLNDPPRERAEGPAQFVSLQTIREQADIISFHVPLNRHGIDKTFHMADTEFLQGLQKKPLIINTCRGEVFDTEAVFKAREVNDISGLVIDCWENEPAINLALLKLADFGTSHIAGYSRDGKANGTKSSVQAISRFFELGINDWEADDVAAPAQPVIDLDGANRAEQAILADAVLATYQIDNDDEALRSKTHLFEQLRGDYPARREFDSYSIRASNIEINTIEKLKRLGFKLCQEDPNSLYPPNNK